MLYINIIVRNLFNIVDQVFDRNSDGYISKSELCQTMKELGVTLTLEDLNEMMNEADVNQDGRIDYAGSLYLLFPCSLLNRTKKYQQNLSHAMQMFVYAQAQNKTNYTIQYFAPILRHSRSDLWLNL